MSRAGGGSQANYQSHTLKDTALDVETATLALKLQQRGSLMLFRLTLNTKNKRGKH